jgi:hypothetical protein
MNVDSAGLDDAFQEMRALSEALALSLTTRDARIASLEAELKEERQRWEDVEHLRPTRANCFYLTNDEGPWKVHWYDRRVDLNCEAKGRTPRQAVDAFRRKVREGSDA